MNGGLIINNCKHCHVEVEAGLQYCPLCQEKLIANQPKAKRSYPIYNYDLIRTAFAINVFWMKILPCILIGAFLIPSLLTIFTGKGNIWLNGETLGIASAWVLVRFTLMSKLNLGKKFLIQITNISLVLFIIDQITGRQGWALNYVIPFLLICSTSAMMYVVYKNKKLWSDYAVYLMSLIFLGFLPCLLYFVKVSSLLWPSAMAAAYAILVLIIVYFFLDKNFKSYFNRRLHF